MIIPIFIFNIITFPIVVLFTMIKAIDGQSERLMYKLEVWNRKK